jgi:hypothetical protein
MRTFREIYDAIPSNRREEIEKRVKELELEIIIYPEELNDYKKVFEFGASKHKANNWLTAGGNKSDHNSMFNSMFHHLADAYAKKDIDHESGLDPLLHLAARALMVYTRKQKGIIHPLDKE